MIVKETTLSKTRRKVMKKVLLSIMTLAILLSAAAIGTNAQVYETDSGIQYSVNNGEITVEGFNYAGNVMNVPEKIDGMPVLYISPQACRKNVAITELRLPKSIVSIGEYAFAECPNLVKVVMSGGIDIGRSAFRDCKAMIELSLPNDLEKIDDFAFEGCTMLGKVKMPKSLSYIGTDAFAGCERLRFDTNGNSYAKEYAKNNSIPTSFKDTWEYTVLMIVLTTALMGGAVFVINIYFRRKKIARQNA